MSETTAAVMAEVLKERKRQDDKWGGSQHDDQHETAYWPLQINEMLLRGQDGTATDTRRLLIEIAALSVAAVESIDRISS